MATNGSTTTKTRTASTGGSTSTTQETGVRENLQKVRTDAAAYVRQTTERAVDVPVGVALTTAERVNELVQPWTATTTREREIKSLRRRVERELNRFERRGAGARRKARQRVRETRNRVERELKQRRKSVETSVKQNRARVETSVKEGRTRVETGVKKAQDAVSALV
jgi:hypothetical protein